LIDKKFYNLLISFSIIYNLKLNLNKTIWRLEIKYRDKNKKERNRMEKTCYLDG